MDTNAECNYEQKLKENIAILLNCLVEIGIFSLKYHRELKVNSCDGKDISL